MTSNPYQSPAAANEQSRTVAANNAISRRRRYGAAVLGGLLAAPMSAAIAYCLTWNRVRINDLKPLSITG